MKFDELFEQRSLVASKLKDCIRDRGYTKVSLYESANEVYKYTYEMLCAPLRKFK